MRWSEYQFFQDVMHPENKDKLHRVSFKNQHQIKNALKPLIGPFGVNYFYYSRMFNSGLYSSFSNHIEWNQWWFNENFHQQCFYFLQPQNYPYGLTISFPFLEEPFHTIQQTAVVKFGIHYVLEVTYRHEDRIESYGFGSDIFNHAVLAQYLTQLSLLKLFFKYFQEKNQELFKQLNGNQVNLAQEIGPAFFNTSSPLFNPCSQLSFLKNIGMEIFSDLSQREKQICENLTKGLSANEIALTLDLSKRTVEYYIDNIKAKLNCFSKSELIQKCLDLEAIGYFLTLAKKF